MKKKYLNLSIIVTTTILFLLVGWFVARSTAQMMEDEVRKTVRTIVDATVERIDGMMSDVETAVGNSVWIVNEHIGDPDYMYRITQQLVLNNHFIVGSAIAFPENFFAAKGLRFSPYSWQNQDGKVLSKQLGTDDYRYHEMEWYKVASDTMKPHWSEPYYDKGGGEVMMCTYSKPVIGPDGKMKAVITSDVSLERLTRHVETIHPYPNSYATLVSAKGSPLADGKPKGTPLKESMVGIVGKADNGWVITLNCPVTNIIADSRRLVSRIMVFSAVGLGLIFALAWFFTKRLEKQEQETSRIRSELAIGAEIQMGMLDRHFPPFLHAALKPAREVGGDFYDFFEKGDRLYFAVGDVSGKGVPSALITFAASSAFRFAADLGLSVCELTSRMNGLLARHNEKSMFMTFFVGVFDRRTGTLDWCNAGHNPPVLVAADGTAEFLKVKRNIVLGAMEDFPYRAETRVFQPGERLVLYSDGITEAETIDHQQYGNERMCRFCSEHAGSPAGDFVSDLFASVDDFAGAAEQFDDQTALVLDFNASSSLVVEAKPENMAKIAAFVEENLLRSGCPASMLPKMMVATDEIAGNVISYSGSPEVRLDFACEGRPASMRLSFIDHGKPWNPLEHADPDTTLAAEDRPIGGLGIMIVKKLATRVDYRREDGQNIFSLEMKV